MVEVVPNAGFNQPTYKVGLQRKGKPETMQMALNLKSVLLLTYQQKVCKVPYKEPSEGTHFQASPTTSDPAGSRCLTPKARLRMASQIAAVKGRKL